MSEDAGILLKLIRLGLGDGAMLEIVRRQGLCSDEASVNWTEILDLAISHGMEAVVCDGFQLLKDNGIEPSIYSFENIDLRLEWFGYLLQSDEDFKKYSSAISKLSALSAKNGAGRLMLLKGYAAGINYPRPERRTYGDIDVFSLDGKSAELDLLLSAYPGYEKREEEKTRHSHATFDDISVENHFHFADPLGNASRDGAVERFLLELAGDASLHMIGEVPVYIPSADFNAVFLVWHMASHFTLENINLRQLCDWWMFLQKEHSNINWDKVLPVLAEGRKMRIFNLVNGVMVDYFGMDESYVPSFSRDAGEKERFMDFVLYAEPLDTKGLEAVLKYMRRKWNFSVAHEQHWLLPLVRAIVNYIKR